MNSLLFHVGVHIQTCKLGCIFARTMTIVIFDQIKLSLSIELGKTAVKHDSALTHVMVHTCPPYHPCFDIPLIQHICCLHMC